MIAAHQSRSKFQIGDPVVFQLGRRSIRATVAEDHGPVGVQGRHIYRVQINMDPYEPQNFILAEDEMTAAIGPSPFDKPVQKEELLEFLVIGGLVGMLQSNSGERNSARTWVCRDNLGNLTYTFVPERGLVGGEVPPGRTLYGDKIFKPKVDEVVKYLCSFGLTINEARHVVLRVGTAP